jgi:hypothetical protein
VQGPLSTASTTPHDPALVYGGNYGDDVRACSLDRLFEADWASALTRVMWVEAVQRCVKQGNQFKSSVAELLEMNGQRMVVEHQASARLTKGVTR